MIHHGEICHLDFRIDFQSHLVGVNELIITHVVYFDFTIVVFFKILKHLFNIVAVKCEHTCAWKSHSYDTMRYVTQI